MPQLSLYIDEQTLRKIEIAARLENLSISKYVVHVIDQTINSSWPESYGQLFGSIQDDTFEVDRQTDFAADVRRESL